MKKKNLKKLSLKKVTIQNLSNEHKRTIKGGYGIDYAYGPVTPKCPIESLLCPPPPLTLICPSILCPTQTISICICDYSYGGSVQVCCA